MHVDTTAGVTLHAPLASVTAQGRGAASEGDTRTLVAQVAAGHPVTVMGALACHDALAPSRASDVVVIRALDARDLGDHVATGPRRVERVEVSDSDHGERAREVACPRVAAREPPRDRLLLVRRGALAQERQRGRPAARVGDARAELLHRIAAGVSLALRHRENHRGRLREQRLAPPCIARRHEREPEGAEARRLIDAPEASCAANSWALSTASAAGEGNEQHDAG